MPVYTYQCEHCGLRFDKKSKIDQRRFTKCMGCAEKAQQIVPEGFSFSFNNELTHAAAPVPQNTGVASVDFDYDKIIKEESDQGWGVIERRVDDKRRLLRGFPGKNGHDVAVAPDGGYRIMSRPERVGVNKQRQAGWEAREKIRRHMHGLT